MPLALLGVGESGTITDIRGKEDVIHHLHNLGFAAGTDVGFHGENLPSLFGGIFSQLQDLVFGGLVCG